MLEIDFRPPSKNVVGRAREVIRKVGGEVDGEHLNFHPPLIFQAACNFMNFDPKRKYVFLGRAMRPLFEAVWQLNLIEKRLPQENITYYVTPMDLSKRRTNRVADQLRRLSIASAEHTAYTLVDFRSNIGRSNKFLSAAISRISSKAKIEQIDQYNPQVGGAIAELDNLGSHVWKNQTGHVGLKGAVESFWLHGNGISFHQARWVLFNSELYKLLSVYKRERK